MKTLQRLGLLVLLALGLQNSARADFAPGFQLGDPTGFTLKSYTDEKRAFDLGLSYSLNEFVILYADMIYQWSLDTIWEHNKRPVYPVYFYAGVGGIFFLSTDSNRRDGRYFTDNGDSLGMGVRIPFGLEKRLDGTPFAVYVEVAPGIGVIPGTFAFIQFALGGRVHL